MKTITMDYDLAMAIGKDAANQRMRKAGRVKWSRGDRNAFVDAFYACFGTTAETAARAYGRSVAKVRKLHAALKKAEHEVKEHRRWRRLLLSTRAHA